MPSLLDITPLGAVLDIGGKLIDKFWPDPATRDAAKLEMFKAQQSGELQILANETDLAKAQIAVNEADAKSGNFWQAGWRPFIGWICGCGLGYQFLVYPILVAFVPKIVQLDMGTLLTLLAGLLGLGTMRMNEKIKGVA
jgi:hypothetical protein